MTATPSRNSRLWHPARGITFSPGPASPASLARNPRTAVELAAPARQYHNIATSQPTGAPGEEAWAATVVKHTIPPSLASQKPTGHVETTILTEAEAEADEDEEADEEMDIEANIDVEVSDRKATDDPPPPVFEYKMADDLFYAAKRSPPGSPGSYWSYTQYGRTAEDGSLEKVKVHYCCSTHTMERVCKEYFMDEKILGFDLEWMPDARIRDGLKYNVSLIQLASPSRIGLFHVALFPKKDDMVGPSFRSLMEDPNVTKLGVAIGGDTTRLRKYLDIHSRGLMELSHLYRVVTCSKKGEYHNINKRLVPLATQVEEYLHLPLYKGQDVRLSNWFRRLDMDQVMYAASDAYAGLHLYATMEHHRQQLNPCPPHPYHAELKLPIPRSEEMMMASPGDVVELDVLPINGDGLEPSEMHLAVARESASVKASLVPKKKPAPTKLILKSTERPKDSRVEVAEDRAASYRASHPDTRATFVQLRSYYLWHGYDLSPAAIAQILRDPPLQTKTIVYYILSVVQSEKMPADPDQLYEVANSVTQSSLQARWPAIAAIVAGR
ncbi:ribonuclease H-like protein [Nemania serpens]|nr:ribonuclease H-like protein [Nemania serpens]